MRRLLLLARPKSSAFAGIELSAVVLLVVLAGLLLPTLRQGKTAPSPVLVLPLVPTSDGQHQAVSAATAGETSGQTRPIFADGSVRKIKFDVNANTFPRSVKGEHRQLLDADY